MLDSRANFPLADSQYLNDDSLDTWSISKFHALQRHPPCVIAPTTRLSVWERHMCRIIAASEHLDKTQAILQICQIHGIFH